MSQRHPYISDYAESLSTGYGVFKTLKIDDYARAISGEPAMVCGNNAVIFVVMLGGVKHLLKCFVRPGACRSDIYDYIKDNNPQLLSPARLLPGEMYVWDGQGCGAYHDVVLAPWIEGVTLGNRVRDAVFRNNNHELHTIASCFDNAMSSLLAQPWAHGDLKPDNIIVTPTADIKLIDYDAMFVPGLERSLAVELGTPG